MKAITIFIVCLATLPISGYCQQFADERRSGDIVSTNKNTDGPGFSIPVYFHTYYCQRGFKMQSPGGKIAFGDTGRQTSNFYTGTVNYGSSIIKNYLQTHKQQNDVCAGIGLAGVIILFKNVAHLVNSIKNKQAAGFKLTCQKTFVRSGSKACNKASGITFSIPIRN